MNILFVNSIHKDVWGGGEKWMVEVGAALRRRGHGIILSGRSYSKFVHRAERKGLETLPMNIHADFDPKIVFEFCAFMVRRKVHVVCTNFEKDNRLAGWAAKMVGGPVVIARKGLPLMADRFLYRMAYREIVKRIIAPSYGIKEAFRKYGWLAPDRIEVIPNGINLSEYPLYTDRFEVRSELTIPADALVIGTVGRLKSQKGHTFFLEAARRIGAVHPQANFLIVGDGPERGRLIAQAEESGIADRVHFLGYREGVPRPLGTMDVFVFPSLFEGLPNALLEAMAMARPVVATRIPGVTEVIQDGQSGLLVPPRDSEALAEAVLDMLAHPDWSRRMGSTARETIAQRFSFTQTVDHVEKVFRETLSEQRAHCCP
ncbi:MAG: glycosyltransferase family 4 protein [Candidatus Latescibacteria bacterium]|nr:glycosyltransferase family 4 protein [Candidatus Latescibacterota bacterium]